MQLRKIGTALVGAVLTSATLMGGALAADLGTFPAPFATDNGIQSTIVVGSSGSVQDVIGAINIGAALAQVGGTVAGGVGATTTATGVKTDDLKLNEAVNVLGTTLKGNKIAGLIDTKITFDDGTKSRNYDVHEEIGLTPTLKVLSSVDDADFGAEIVLATINKPAVTYTYVFEKDSNMDISKITATNPLEVTILGKRLKITNVDNASNSITVQEGMEVAMGMDTKVEIDGKVLEVTAIGQGTAAFKVGVHTAFINYNSESPVTKEIGTSGIKVTLDNLLYTDDAGSRQVLVTAGTSTTDTITDGDPMTMFGEVDDSTDAVWLWSIEASETPGEELRIGAKHNQKYDELDEDVITLGNKLSFPNDYAAISLDALTVSDFGRYELYFETVDFTVGPDEQSITTIENVNVITLRAIDGNDDGFKVSVPGSIDEDADIVYIGLKDTTNGGLIYGFKNSNNKNQIASYGEESAAEFNLTFEDTVMAVAGDNETNQVTITDANNDIIALNVSATWNSLQKKTDAEADDVVIATKSKGTEENDVRMTYGTLILAPKANAEKDKVIFEVPAEVLKVTVTVSGPGSSVTTVAGVAGGYTPAALPATGIAKLDSDAEAAKTGNLILVGGPAVNSIVAELAAAGKTRTTAQWRTETDGVRDYKDSALIQAVDSAFTNGKTALVVAGYGADDTGNAAYVLQNYAKFADQLAGKSEVTVTGTTTDAVQ
ncbi:MAG: S-layer protein [DPANN group archaeon]|nr:S-layer protein [DPANN group archaeon]